MTSDVGRPVPSGSGEVVDYIAQTKAAYDKLGYESYRWAENLDAAPFASLAKPLSESRVALIASGGVYQVGQTAFHHRDDSSHRRIPTDVDTAELRTSHFAYDLTAARTDPNSVFPIDPLRALVDEGHIGELTSHALTFMGGIYSQRRVHEELIPALAADIAEMAADVVLLVPV